MIDLAMLVVMSDKHMWMQLCSLMCKPPSSPCLGVIVQKLFLSVQIGLFFSTYGSSALLD